MCVRTLGLLVYGLFSTSRTSVYMLRSVIAVDQAIFYQTLSCAYPHERICIAINFDW